MRPTSENPSKREHLFRRKIWLQGRAERKVSSDASSLDCEPLPVDTLSVRLNTVTARAWKPRAGSPINVYEQFQCQVLLVIFNHSLKAEQGEMSPVWVESCSIQRGTQQRELTFLSTSYVPGSGLKAPGSHLISSCQTPSCEVRVTFIFRVRKLK